MQLLLYFLYPFPIASIKVFWSSGNIPMYAWTISTVGHLMPLWLLEHYSTWKNPLCHLKCFDKGECIFPVPILHVHACRNTPPHPPCNQTACLLEVMPQVCLVKPESGLRWPYSVTGNIQSNFILKKNAVISNLIAFHCLKYEVLYKK